MRVSAYGSSQNSPVSIRRIETIVSNHNTHYVGVITLDLAHNFIVGVALTISGEELIYLCWLDIIRNVTEGWNARTRGEKWANLSRNSRVQGTVL